jgi:hypothetical protein
MTTPAPYAPLGDNLPYADPEPFDEVLAECECVQAECEAHRIGDLHGRPGVAGHPVHPVVIDDRTRHLVDGYSDYGG